MAKVYEGSKEVGGKSAITSAQAASRARWHAEKSPEARRRRVRELSEERAARSPVEQIALLDKRLGPYQGAERERARLHALIDQQ